MLVTSGYRLTPGNVCTGNGARETPYQARDYTAFMCSGNSQLALIRYRAGRPCCGGSDKNQRRKRSPMACFMTAPPTSEMDRVSGMSLGQTSTQFCA
jgi:hypothetical protein